MAAAAGLAEAWLSQPLSSRQAWLGFSSVKNGIPRPTHSSMLAVMTGRRQRRRPSSRRSTSAGEEDEKALT